MMNFLLVLVGCQDVDTLFCTQVADCNERGDFDGAYESCMHGREIGDAVNGCEREKRAHLRCFIEEGECSGGTFMMMTNVCDDLQAAYLECRANEG